MEIPGRASRRDRFFRDLVRSLQGIGPCAQRAGGRLQYKDRIDFYKVDIDQEQELAAVFGVRSVPTLLFIPLSGMPQMMTGGRPKSDLKRIIDEVLMGK